MNFLRHLAREYLLQRVLGPRHHRRGYRGVPRRRGFFMPAPRRRRHSNVRVSGCCLPIPLAMTVGSAVAVRQLAGRARR